VAWPDDDHAPLTTPRSPEVGDLRGAALHVIEETHPARGPAGRRA
jgi:hypothetical protein